MRILLLLISAAAWAQSPLERSPVQWARQYNGTSQYESKSSPSSMDLNGAELIPVTTTFDDNVTGWTVATASVGTLTRNTNADRVRTGTGSAQFVNTTGIGGNNLGFRLTSSISNSVTNARANKFTFEAWVYVPSTDSLRKVFIRELNQSGTPFALTPTATVIPANTWTKLVLNGLAPGTQTAITVDIYLTAAGVNDTLYVDDVSLTQAYDLLALAVVKTDYNASAGYRSILSGYSAAGAAPLFALQQNTANNLVVALRDGVNSINYSSGLSVNDGRWNLLCGTWDRTGSEIAWKNGTTSSGSAITSVGKINVTTFTIGYDASSYIGVASYVGPIVIVRYDALPSDIASLIMYAAKTWRQNGLQMNYKGGTVVFSNDRRTGLDLSGFGNTLTPTAAPPVIPIN